MSTVESIDNRALFYQTHKQCLHDRLLTQTTAVFEKIYGIPMDPTVTQAMRIVPRHNFAPDSSFARVYRNKIVPLEKNIIRSKVEAAGIAWDKTELSFSDISLIESIILDCNATASEPALIAYMVQTVMPNKTANSELSALEIGCGTGYVCKILSEVGFNQVVGIEQKPHLAERAKEILADDNKVEILCRDGKEGLPDRKFDAIIVSALIRDPQVFVNLTEQLNTGGKLSAPLADSVWAEIPESTNSHVGRLVVATKDESVDIQIKGAVQFVHLT